MADFKPQKIVWFDALDHFFDDVLGHDLDEIKEQVAAGICELWQVGKKSYVVTRAECDQGGRPNEFCIVAGRGENAHGVISGFAEGAKRQGFKAVRIHSKRPGMGRHLKKIGFKTAETVYKMEL
jgi:hypothetical protein